MTYADIHLSFAHCNLPALLAYDLLLSASREKHLVWDQKFRVSSVIYLFLRYPVIAFQVFNVCISYTAQQEVCSRSCRVSQRCRTDNDLVVRIFLTSVIPDITDKVSPIYDSCDALYRFAWALSIIVTRVAISGTSPSHCLSIGFTNDCRISLLHAARLCDHGTHSQRANRYLHAGSDRCIYHRPRCGTYS